MKVIRECARDGCTAVLATTEAEIRRGKGRYCSRSCAGYATNRRGEDHPCWKGADATPHSQRRRAHALYALGDCERCGRQAVERHHIDADTNNNEPENIAILCRRCHMEVDGRLVRLLARAPKKLTLEQVEEIRRLVAQVRGDRPRSPIGFVPQVAARYGVSQTTIRDIASGRKWSK